MNGNKELKDKIIKYYKISKIVLIEAFIIFIFLRNLHLIELWRYIKKEYIDPRNVKIKKVVVFQENPIETQSESEVIYRFLQEEEQDKYLDWIFKDEPFEFVDEMYLNAYSYFYYKNRYCRKFMVFTDIIDSTSMWTWSLGDMHEALEIHNKIARSINVEYNGWEIANEGDAFHMVFERGIDALNFAFNFHDALTGIKWPEGIIIHNTIAGKPLDFLGLKVRIVIGYGFINKWVTNFGVYYYGKHILGIKDMSDRVRKYDIHVCGCVQRAIKQDIDNIINVEDFIYKYFCDTEINYNINVACNMHRSKL